MSDPNTHPEEQAADTEPVDPGEVSEDQPDEREERKEASVLIDGEELPDPPIEP